MIFFQNFHFKSGLVEFYILICNFDENKKCKKIKKIKFLNIQSVLYLYLFLNLLVFPKAQEWPLVSYSGSVSGFST